MGYMKVFAMKSFVMNPQQVSSRIRIILVGIYWRGWKKKLMEICEK